MASTQGTVKTTTETNTMVDNDVLNPSVVNTTGRKVVHLTLVFDGVDFVPNDLLDALDAAYTNVTAEKNNESHGIYIWNISA